jgi:hypothetical protein
MSAVRHEDAQVFCGGGVFTCMKAAAAAAAAGAPLQVLESVCCLECGEIYSKPAAGGIAETNPGCPACGYVGWISLSLPGEPSARLRYDVGRRQHRSARSR